MSKQSRRNFLGYTFAAVGAVGAGSALFGIKKVLDPLPSVVNAGFTTVDLATAGLEAGKPRTFTWRGKPVFILLKDDNMEKSKDDLILDDKHYTVVIGLCTHLGCIPVWNKTEWYCPCHGGKFDANGRHSFGPPPKPMIVPPFKVDGTKLVFGESSDISNAMQKARA